MLKMRIDANGSVTVNQNDIYCDSENANRECVVRVGGSSSVAPDAAPGWKCVGSKRVNTFPGWTSYYVDVQE